MNADDMGLGTVDVFEVWFAPAARENNPPRVITRSSDLDYVNEYMQTSLPHCPGQVEIVRVRTTRQIITVSAETVRGKVVAEVPE